MTCFKSCLPAWVSNMLSQNSLFPFEYAFTRKLWRITMMPWNFFGVKTAIRKYTLVSLSNFRLTDSKLVVDALTAMTSHFLFMRILKKSGVILNRERLFNGFFRVYIASFNFEWFWENTSQVIKFKPHLMVCTTFEIFPTSRVLRRGHVLNSQKVLRCKLQIFLKNKRKSKTFWVYALQCKLIHFSTDENAHTFLNNLSNLVRDKYRERRY